MRAFKHWNILFRHSKSLKKLGYESEKHASDKTSCRFVETTEWGCVVRFARDQRKSTLVLTHRRVSYCSEHAAGHRWILLASATVALVKLCGRHGRTGAEANTLQIVASKDVEHAQSHGCSSAATW